MPTLDVSQIILDPVLAQAFTILRTEQVISPTTGRTSRTTTNIQAYGVVTEGAFDPLYRTPQYEVNRDTVKVVTLTPLYMVSRSTDSAGVVHHFEPDQVLWKNNYYTMIKVYDYSTYGQGFYIGTFEIADSESIH